AALLRMAFVAVVVDSGLFEQRLPVTAVRIVAVAARHLAFAQRHVRRGPDLGPLVLVTLETRGPPGGLGPLMLRGHICHDRVAIRAGKPARFMRAAAPQDAIALFMTAQADRVEFVGRMRLIVEAERDDPADSASAARLHVQRAGAVAGLAVRPLLRVAR